MKNTYKIIAFTTLALVVLSSVSPALAAATALKAKGKAKFVLKGTVTAVAANSLSIHVTNTSKNAKLFDSQDKTISVGPKTRITKNGKALSLDKIKSGDRVKIFGILDKKSGTIAFVRWIKVMPK